MSKRSKFVKRIKAAQKEMVDIIKKAKKFNDEDAEWIYNKIQNLPAFEHALGHDLNTRATKNEDDDLPF